MAPTNFDKSASDIAALVLERLGDLIAIMEKAANQAACGGPLEEIEVGDYQLYMAEGDERAILCVWMAEDYFDLLNSVASDRGINLQDAEELHVDMPDAEFEESLVTGGFAAWKGFSVERKNRLLEDILDCVCRRLQVQGIEVNCSDEECVVFRLPVREQD